MGQKIKLLSFSSNHSKSHGFITNGGWTSHFHGLNRREGRSLILNFKKEVFSVWMNTHTCAFFWCSNVDLPSDEHILLPIEQDSKGRQFEGSIPNLLIKGPMPMGKF